LEKKAAKAEKDRKIKEAASKSRSLMANFFTKPKVVISSNSRDELSSAGASTSQSEFERVFKPFVQKKNMVIAPTNWFKESGKTKGKKQAIAADAEVIVIDEEAARRDVQMAEPELPESVLVSMTARGKLFSHASIPVRLTSVV